MGLRPLTNCDPALRYCWHPVAFSADVKEGGPIAVRLLGQSYVLVRFPSSDDSVAAFIDMCPHRHYPLSKGRIVDGLLECGYHGWRFSSSGQCLSIPNSSEQPPKRALAQAVSACELYDLVWIAPESPITPPIDIPEWNDASFIRGSLPALRVRVNAGLMIDNFLDFAHFPVVHASTFGMGPLAQQRVQQIVDYKPKLSSWGFQAQGKHRVYSSTGTDEQLFSITYRYSVPFSVIASLKNHNTGFMATTAMSVHPEDMDSCVIYYSLLYKGLGTDVPDLEQALAFERAILDEDLRIQENFINLQLPLEPSSEVHTRFDILTIQQRKLLTKLVRFVEQR